MKSCKEYHLPNGLLVLHQKKDTESVSIQVTVQVGSNNEESSKRGISHFLEHMVFEGTKNRDAETIAREIEGIGGEIGAYTSNERTCFYVNCLKKHFEKGIDILFDVVTNPAFLSEMIEKERGVILSEVKMREDESRMHQWTIFLSTLYKNHPARHPVIGYEKNIKSITRKDLQEFHSKYYLPNNMILSVTGGGFQMSAIREQFGSLTRGRNRTIISIKEPQKTLTKTRSIKRDISQSFTIVGCKTVPRESKDSYVLDVIQAILGKGLSGRLFIEVRTKRGLAYDVGVHHETKADYGFFAYYVNTDRKNLQTCRNIFKKELMKLDDISTTELQESKNFIEGSFIMEHEDNHSLSDSLGEWASRGRLNELHNYIDKIKRITKKDILQTRDRYLKEFVTTTIFQK